MPAACPNRRFSVRFPAVVTLLGAFAPLMLSVEALKEWLWLIYAVQYASIFSTARLAASPRAIFFFCPSFVAVSYLLISFSLGAYSFAHGIVYSPVDLAAFNSWRFLPYSAVYVLLCNFACILAYQHAQSGRSIPTVTDEVVKRSTGQAFAISLIAIAVILIFVVIELDLTWLGGRGDFGVIPQTLAAILAMIALVKNRVPKRHLFYLCLLVFFASFSSNDKRVAVFLLAPMVLLEAVRSGRSIIRAQFIFGGAVLVALTGILILMMSIYRGYGNYNPASFFDSRKYLVDYITSDRFAESFFNNIETNSLFFHTHQALEYVIEDSDLLLYGATFFKILFIPVPRALFPEKPLSIIDHYTVQHSPEFRSEGGSWVISMYAEFFWNFHFLGVVFLYAILYAFNRLYFALVSHLRCRLEYRCVLGLYAYEMFPTLVRGSGLDLYMLYFIMAGILYVTCFHPLVLLISAATDSARRRRLRRTIGKLET